MKSAVAKSLHILLALFILAAALGPACAGSENCSMPCCRHKANPVSRPTDMVPGRSCCTQAAGDSADNMSGCRFVKTSPALPSGAGSVTGMTAAVGAVAFDNPIERPSGTPSICSMDSRPPGPPLHLRLQTLLI
jgi:hypothetical protein